MLYYTIFTPYAPPVFVLIKFLKYSIIKTAEILRNISQLSFSSSTVEDAWQ